MTVRDWINRSARLAGIVAAGETLQGSDIQDSLDVASDLLDAWAADRLTVYTQSRTENALAERNAALHTRSRRRVESGSATLDRRRHV
jgi:hypothetical protein